MIIDVGFQLPEHKKTLILTLMYRGYITNTSDHIEHIKELHTLPNY